MRGQRIWFFALLDDLIENIAVKFLLQGCLAGNVEYFENWSFLENAVFAVAVAEKKFDHILIDIFIFIHKRAWLLNRDRDLLIIKPF